MKHVARFDWLRVVGAFMIVGCHLVFTPTEGSWYEFAKKFTDFCVGLFGLMSGFIMCQQLAERPVPFAEFAVKRAKRLLPVYLAWSLFFIAANCLFDAVLHKPATFDLASGRVWLKALLIGASSPHLWFLIALFYGQLLLYYPVRLVKTNAKAAPVLLLTGVLSLWITVTCSERSCSWWEIGLYHFRLFAYLCFGAFFSGVHAPLQALARKKPLMAHLLLLMLAITSCSIFLRCAGLNGFWRAAILCLPFFLWALSGPDAQPAAQGVLSKLAAASMGVYCLHPVITVIAYTAVRKMNLPASDGIVFAGWFLSWLVSLAGALILKSSRKTAWTVA